MAAPSKTQGTSVLSLQSVATAAVVLSSAIDVSTKFGGTMFVHFGRRAATALTAGCRFRIEASSKSSADGHWYPLYEWVSAIAASETEAATGTNASGQAVITVASTTNLVAGDKIFIDNTTIGNSEWGRIKSIVANTSVTLEDNLVNAQDSGAATIYDQAEWWAVPLDLTAVGRIRLVADTATGPTGQNVAVEATLVTFDSVA